MSAPSLKKNKNNKKRGRTGQDAIADHTNPTGAVNRYVRIHSITQKKCTKQISIQLHKGYPFEIQPQPKTTHVHQ